MFFQVVDVLTFNEDRREAALLHRRVGHEFDVHLVRGRLDVTRHSMSTELAEQSRAVLVTVAHFDEVIDAVVVILHLQQQRRKRFLRRQYTNKRAVETEQ